MLGLGTQMGQVLAKSVPGTGSSMEGKASEASSSSVLFG